MAEDTQSAEGVTDAKPDYEEVVAEANERFTQIQEDDGENRDNQRKDFEFVYVPGKQWTQEVRDRRKNWDEPCLEFDQLKQFVNQVVNDERQNKPAILVHPANGEASKEVAEIEQGLIRAIEYDSNAEAAYDNGFQGAVVGGRGWWRICTEYERGTDPMTMWNQKIVIKPILDHLTVFADLNYTEADASDRNFLFVLEKVQKDDFAKRWPDAEPLSWDRLDENWREGKDIIYVADYYRRVCKVRKMVLMSDGATGWKDEMPKPPEGVTEIKSRDVETYTVEWYKIAGGDQVLEEYDCPGEIIPVIQTCGDDIIIDGKRIYQGLITKARDAQAMYNYGMTQQAIHLGLTPKAPYMAAQEAIEDYQDIWKNANTINYSVLPWKHKDKDGEPIPPPQRVQPSMTDAGWAQWCGSMQAVMRSTIGMYENSLGMKGTEVSGKAILAREKQGDVGTFHFVDNQHRAIALTGRIIQRWIPVYYDTERIVHIIGPDGKRKMVTLNQTSPNAADPLKAIKLNDVTVGEYATVIEAGPGFATKREETAEKLMSLVNSFPQMMQVAGDVVMRSLDVSDADQIAERFRLALPPPIQQAIAMQEQGVKPDPVMMNKMAQLQGQLQQAHEAMQEMQQENQQLKAGVQESAMKIEAHKQEQLGKLKVDKQIHDERIKMEIASALDKHELEKQNADRDAILTKYKAELEAKTKLEVAEISAGATIQAAQIAAANKAVSSESVQ